MRWRHQATKEKGRVVIICRCSFLGQDNGYILFWLGIVFFLYDAYDNARQGLV